MCIRDSIESELTLVQHTPATQMDHGLVANVKEAIEDSELPVKTMVSGAGHDAMIMAQIAPSCMLFVRCRDGVSHHPDEFVEPEDVCVALQVMVNSLIRISENINSQDKET